jgi:hypothetical protein
MFELPTIHIAVNNAGIMASPYALTAVRLSSFESFLCPNCFVGRFRSPVSIQPSRTFPVYFAAAPTFDQDLQSIKML